MTSDQIIQELERYRSEFIGIMGRYIHGHDHITIKREDDPRFRSFVIETIDLLNDSIGKNQYSPLINQIFNEGISNYIQSPSYKSVEDIISVIDSVITRLKRTPDFYIKKEPQKQEEPIKTKLQPPEKMTLKWVWEHTPTSYYWTVLVFLFGIFCLGIAFGKTNLYKSLINEATANAVTNKNTPPTSE